MKSHQLINADSGNVEYYTPQFIIDAARGVMGGIDLDPASSINANRVVCAKQFFSREDDGLSKAWETERLWMNHPFSRKGNPAWIGKLIAEVKSGRVKQACCICFAATSEKWFQPLLRQPQCFLSPRTNFYLPDGTKKRGVSKGSVVTYFGPNKTSFAAIFCNYGVVK